MFSKILVGVDFSPAESSLLSCLPDLLNWGVEKVVLAHVIKVGYSQGAGYGHEGAYLAQLEKDAAPLREAGLEVDVSVTASGVVADELLRIAHEEGAELVVVGSRSHNFLYEVFLGSVAKEILRKADLPVLIERLEPSRAGDAATCAAVCSRSLERVLLATDLSERSSAAEEAALQLATKADAVDILTVLSDGGGESERHAVENHHQELARRMKQTGIVAESRIQIGGPADTITRAAQEGYTLIVVGKHGRNWIEGKIIGSTAAKVCEIAQRPVLMVPAS